jgi:mannosyltransferase OCH1-like enzyme
MIDSKPGRPPSPFQPRLTRQIQRFLPALFAGVLILYFIIHGSWGDPSLRTVSKAREFPKKIWQLWKVDVLSLEQRDLPRAKSWIQNNPGHRYEVLTDDNDVQYVETVYGLDGLNRPDIVHMYKSITAKIVRADILRYLVMYAEGGVYTDIDVESLRPVSRFIPEQYEGRDIDMVIGIEVDQPEYANHPILGGKCKSFCQWTFMCKPGLPVMLKLVERITTWLTEVARRQNVPISEVQLDFDDIIAGTGPSAFTEAILEDISARVGYTVGWETFHNLAESKLIAGVLVLTVEAFAAGQGHSDSGNHNARTALVKHHYHASGWPSSHPRFNHPIYGEVERCNWNAQCVAQWDADTAAWNQMPLTEQTVKLAVKMEQDALAAAEAQRVAEAAKKAAPNGGSAQAGTAAAVERAKEPSI